MYAAKRRLYNLLESSVDICNTIMAELKLESGFEACQYRYKLPDFVQGARSHLLERELRARSLIAVELRDWTARVLFGHVLRTALYRVDPTHFWRRPPPTVKLFRRESERRFVQAGGIAISSV